MGKSTGDFYKIDFYVMFSIIVFDVNFDVNNLHRVR